MLGEKKGTQKRQLKDVSPLLPGERQKDESFAIHESQIKSAEEMLGKIERAIKIDSFERFQFVIMVPDLNTLRSQTVERLEEMVEYVRDKLTGDDAARKSFGSHVVARTLVFKASGKSPHDRNAALGVHRRILTNPKTLFLVVVDEAHAWAGSAGLSAFDLFVNGPFLPDQPERSQVVRRAENTVTLFVSATPYSLQTRNSQVRQR